MTAKKLKQRIYDIKWEYENAPEKCKLYSMEYLGELVALLDKVDWYDPSDIQPQAKKTKKEANKK